MYKQTLVGCCIGWYLSVDPADTDGLRNYAGCPREANDCKRLHVPPSFPHYCININAQISKCLKLA